ncbi:MAG: GNAT family N-acetyltransferase, partial [bacterium]
KNLHIRSMAVKADYQGKGIGWRILQEINGLAKKKHCQTITLESFEPLTKAVSLYEKFGFRRTGRKKNLYGIRIFEMLRLVRV